ncbi:hypothetical protein [Pantoea sp. Cy-639]|jgi:predicted PhzF superfamily epimerase YddE/YHI9|nr:hypothetical protein [Pantoea sp. Cy-639]
MQLEIFQVDAFSSVPFDGNPAAGRVIIRGRGALYLRGVISV